VQEYYISVANCWTKLQATFLGMFYVFHCLVKPSVIYSIFSRANTMFHESLVDKECPLSMCFPVTLCYKGFHKIQERTSRGT